MSKMLKALLSICISFFAFSAHALYQDNVVVSFVGSQSAGTNSVILFFSLGTNNPNSCAWSAVLFTDEASRKDALIVAMTAKALVKPVRIDYTRDAAGNCIGSALYSQ
jgi:hypothetical protein